MDKNIILVGDLVKANQRCVGRFPRVSLGRQFLVIGRAISPKDWIDLKHIDGDDKGLTWLGVKDCYFNLVKRGKDNLWIEGYPKRNDPHQTNEN